MGLRGDCKFVPLFQAGLTGTNALDWENVEIGQYDCQVLRGDGRETGVKVG